MYGQWTYVAAQEQPVKLPAYYVCKVTGTSLHLTYHPMQDDKESFATVRDSNAMSDPQRQILGRKSLSNDLSILDALKTVQEWAAPLIAKRIETNLVAARVRIEAFSLPQG